jgi:hypothetical protein
MALHHRPGALDARRSDARRHILLERLVEGAALAPVEGEYRLVLGDAAERL